MGLFGTRTRSKFQSLAYISLRLLTTLPYRLDFWVAEVPKARLCLLKLFLALGVHARAFEAGFGTATEFLKWSPPVEFEGKFHEATWKSDFLEKMIVSLSYSQFWRLWDQTLTVLGLIGDDRIRPIP